MVSNIPGFIIFNISVVDPEGSESFKRLEVVDPDPQLEVMDLALDPELNLNLIKNHQKN
jgi:hypothetical protein